MPVVRVSLRHGVRGSNGSADDARLKCRVDRSCRRLCRDRSDRRYAGAGDADAPWCVGVAVLIAGMLLFSLRWVGGGDAKLLAAAALWIGYEQLLPFLVIVTIFGGALALFLLAYRSVPASALPLPAWALRLHSAGESMPDGIAIAAGALAVYPLTTWPAQLAG